MEINDFLNIQTIKAIVDGSKNPKIKQKFIIFSANLAFPSPKSVPTRIIKPILIPKGTIYSKGSNYK